MAASHQLFDGEKDKTLIAEFSLNRRLWILKRGVFLSAGLGLLSISVLLLSTAHIVEFQYGMNKWLLYLIVIPLVIPISWLTYHNIRMIRLNHGLRLYNDGFLLPSSDIYGDRFQPEFFNFLQIQAIWFYTESLTKQEATFGYGINLGKDPVRIWGQDKVQVIEPNQYSIPAEITILKIAVKKNNSNYMLTTGERTLENGYSAMFQLIKMILEIKEIHK